MQYLVSTIIPFYNSKKYIEEAIQSVLNQTIGFNNIELILINDGSTDDTEKIIQKFTQKYDNIKYYYQKNTGVGLASNKGLELSTGKYVTFLGSDDILDKNAYENLYNNAEKNNAEISMGKIILFNSKKEWALKSHSIIFSEDKLSHIKNDLGLIFNASPANKLFLSSFIKKNNILYPNLRSHADAPFVVPLLFLSNKCSITKKSVYYWRQDNNQQITKNYDKEQSMSNLNKSTDIINDFLIKNGFKKYRISIILKNYSIYQKIIRESIKNKKFDFVIKYYRKFLITINQKEFAMLPTLKKYEVTAIKKRYNNLAYLIVVIYKFLFGSFNAFHYLQKRKCDV